jgi:hypothetical protein
MASPGEVYFEGAIDLAVRNGLRTMVIIHHSSSKARATGAVEFAKKKGLQMLFVEEYSKETTDFTPVLTRGRIRSSSEPRRLAPRQPPRRPRLPPAPAHRARAADLAPLARQLRGASAGLGRARWRSWTQ